MTLILTPDRVWDGLSDTPRERAAVVIEGDRVCSLDERSDRLPQGADRLSLPGHTLMPGLIDCHVHPSSGPGATDADIEVPLSRRHLQLATALRTLLGNGFTTVRSMGSVLPAPMELLVRETVDGGLLEGPRMIIAPHIISARGAHGDQSAQIGSRPEAELGALADGEQEILRTVRTEARDGADWIKFAASGGFTSPSDQPDQTTYTRHEMEVLVGAAADLGLPCAVHAFGDEGVRRALRAGVRSVEHGALVELETLAEMADRGVYLVPTQILVQEGLDHLDDDAFWEGKPAARMKFRTHEKALRGTAEALKDSDVKIAYGTDSGVLPHEDNPQEFLAMVRNGIPPVRALRAATSTAAELLDREDIGRIAPGACADLVAVPGNPFTDIAVMAEVDLVIQQGVIRKNTTGHGVSRSSTP